MDLKEAIAHAENKAGDCATDCKREHKQLAEWLHELLLLQVENAALKEQVTQLQTIITEEAKESGEVIIERDTLKERIARLEDLNRKLCDKANTLTIQSARLEETITALQSKSAALVDALTNAQSSMPCPMYEEALAAFKG